MPLCVSRLLLHDGLPVAFPVVLRLVHNGPALAMGKEMTRWNLSTADLERLADRGQVDRAEADRVIASMNSGRAKHRELERQVVATIPRRKLDAPVYFEVPIDIWTENRVRAISHPIARGKHLKRQRETVRNVWNLLHFRGWLPEFPLAVTMWRIARHTDPEDNLPPSMKHIKDEIAELLGMRNDDRPDLVTWRFDQKPPGAEGPRLGIQVEAR